MKLPLIRENSKNWHILLLILKTIETTTQKQKSLHNKSRRMSAHATENLIYGLKVVDSQIFSGIQIVLNIHLIYVVFFFRPQIHISFSMRHTDWSRKAQGKFNCGNFF